jgi:excisionase family DNA binding protein
MPFETTAAKDYITIGELAAQWRCTEAHLYTLIKRGALPAFRVGRRVIVRADAAQAFIERNATAPLQAA